jgi:broad specificity phosphatase PhoE
VLVLARHGETQANASGLLLGRADVELTERGRRQAKALAAAVPDARVVISSPLARARDTAAAFGLPVEVDDRWIEIDYGDWDERPSGAVSSADWDRWRNDVTFVPPGGESLASVGARVRDACEELAERAAASDGDIVVVSHVSPIKAGVAWALGVGDEIVWRLYCAVASVSRVGTGPRGAFLLSFNETAHLAALA